MNGWRETLEAWLEIVGPNVYLRAAIIFVVSLVVAKLADWVFCGLVASMARRTRSQVDDKIIAILHRPIFLSVVIVGLCLAAWQLPLEETPRKITYRLLASLAIFIWLGFAIRFGRIVLDVLARHQDRFDLVQPRTLPLFHNLSLIICIGAALYLLLISWGVDLTAWLASAGIVGIAVGFAAKDTLANLFAGVFILADAPYKIGDFIILDSGERGRITQIGIRSTRMLTRDDIEITIPNAVIGASKIINESGGPHEKERVRVPVGVAYGSDIDQVQEILLGLAQGHPEICTDPAPRVRFRRFGASSLDFELLCWIEEPLLRGRLVHALNCEVYKAFQENDVEIPFTKQDLYIKEMPSSE